MRRKVLAMVLSAVMTAGVLAGCGNSSAEKSTADTKGTDSKEATYTVGISQFAEHGSLDNCREGFLEGLKEAGIEEGVNLDVILDNAQADTGTAMSAYNSTKGTEIPVIYTAVSDPVAAQLATEDGTPVGNITGTSDALPVEEQLKMIRATLPDAKKIGILYTTSETNSESTIATYKELAGDYGFEIVDTGINTIADVEMAAKDLVTKVDCITNLTDNTVVSALQTVLAAANDAKIPVFGSEVEQVKNGCLASMGIDYVSLGKQTGEMAAKVLKGEAKASELNYELITEPSFYENTEVADNLGITLDESYVSGAAEMFDSIEVE